MNKENKIQFKKIHITLIALLIILSTLNVSGSKINIIGWVALLFLLLLVIFFNIAYINKRKSYPPQISTIQITLLLFNILYLIGTVNEGFKVRGLIIYIQLSLLMVYVVLMTLMNWDYREIKIISKFIEVFIIINIIALIFMKFPYPFKSFANNTNVFSAIIFFLSFFPIMNFLLSKNSIKKRYLFYIIMANMLLVIMGQSRAIWITAIISIVVFCKWNIITKNKTRYYLFFGTVIITSIGVIILLPLLSQHPDALIWNKFIWERTGANLFSGREKIWGQLLLAIMEKPIMGHGASATPYDLISIRLSSHNLYIQTAIQVGLLGVSSLFILLLSFWSVMYKGRDNIYTRLSGSYFIGIIIYQSAEVSLTQNNMVVGIIMWLIIAIGVSNAIICAQSNFKSINEIK